MLRVGVETSFPFTNSQVGEAFLQSMSASYLHFHFPFHLSGLSPDIFPQQCGRDNRTLESGKPRLGPPLCPVWTRRPLGSSFLFVSLSVVCKWGQMHPTYWFLGNSNEEVRVQHLACAGVPVLVFTIWRHACGCLLWGNVPSVSHGPHFRGFSCSISMNECRKRKGEMGMVIHRCLRFPKHFSYN